MTDILIRRLGTFLLTGSIVNDAFIINQSSFFTWAKVMFLMGFAMSLATGFSIKRITKVESWVLLHTLFLLIITLFSSGAGFTNKTSSLLISLIMGAITFLVFFRLKISTKLIVTYYIYWVLIGVVIGLIQSFFGVFFFTDRIFESGILIGTYRASGLMSDPNYFALICLLGIAFSVSINISVLIKYVLLMGILLSGSRSGLIIGVLLFMLENISGTFSKRSILMAIGMSGIILGMLIYFSEYLPPSISMLFGVRRKDDAKGSKGDDIVRTSINSWDSLTDIEIQSQWNSSSTNLDF
jgi:hypothetical protein